VPTEQDRNLGACGNFQFLTDSSHDQRGPKKSPHPGVDSQ
jgi:hypothetical protein